MKLIKRKTYMIASKSQRGTMHKVEYIMSHWYCDCTSFAMRGKCSHIPIAEKIKIHQDGEKTNDRQQVLVR